MSTCVLEQLSMHSGKDGFCKKTNYNIYFPKGAMTDCLVAMVTWPPGFVRPCFNNWKNKCKLFTVRRFLNMKISSISLLRRAGISQYKVLKVFRSFTVTLYTCWSLGYVHICNCFYLSFNEICFPFFRYIFKRKIYIFLL